MATIFGSGQMNVFVCTNDPLQTLGCVRKVPESLHPATCMKVGYRDVGDDAYVVLWPPNSPEFHVI
jgi:hypothetical protein